jgi:AraC-like DNA-binding protein
MDSAATTVPTVQLFAPPYTRLDVVHQPPDQVREFPRGAALVWYICDAARQEREFEQLRDRAFGLPLIVMLPPPRDIHRTLPLLNFVNALRPSAVLPGPSLGTPHDLRHVLATPPRAVPDTLLQYFMHRGLLPNRIIAREVRRIFELAPEVNSITRLARRMYTSRRTLGRHFALASLPVPSHWLQFARLIHVAVRIQAHPGAIFRIASRAGYPDGFTMSNQMKRLIGCRPTEVRQCLGWEWIVEAWLEREERQGHLRLKRQ